MRAIPRATAALWVGAVLVSIITSACSRLTDATQPGGGSIGYKPPTPPSGEPAQPPAPSGPSDALYSAADIACVAKQVKAARDPWNSAYTRLLTLASAERTHVPAPVADYNVPGINIDPTGFWAAVNGITHDADAAYEMAVVYSITGDTTYARPSAAIIRAWATTNTQVTGHDGQLSMAEVGAGFILSAELLQTYGGWTSADQATFQGWVGNVYYPLAAVQIRDRTNNWGDWGIFASVLAHHYLGQQAGLDSETVRLQAHVDSQIADDGSLPEEIARGPGAEVWYTYFALDPMTAAARALRNAGEPDLLTWTSPKGHTIPAALDHLLYLTQNAGSLGLTGPRTQDPWPADLFDAMGVISGNSSWASYATTKSPNMYVGHHYAWTFPSLEGVTAGVCS
jgi:hypothetical protein